MENTVLSNLKIDELITGFESNQTQNSVSNGGYWRKVLVERGFIASRRRYKTLWGDKISYEQFVSMKKWFTEQYGYVTYKNGRVVQPIVSEVMVLNGSIDTSIYNSSILNNKILGVEGHPLALS